MKKKPKKADTKKKPEANRAHFKIKALKPNPKSRIMGWEACLQQQISSSQRHWQRFLIAKVFQRCTSVQLPLKPRVKDSSYFTAPILGDKNKDARTVIIATLWKQALMGCWEIEDKWIRSRSTAGMFLLLLPSYRRRKRDFPEAAKQWFLGTGPLTTMVEIIWNTKILQWCMLLGSIPSPPKVRALQHREK